MLKNIKALSNKVANNNNPLPILKTKATYYTYAEMQQHEAALLAHKNDNTINIFELISQTTDFTKWILSQKHHLTAAEVKKDRETYYKIENTLSHNLVLYASENFPSFFKLCDKKIVEIMTMLLCEPFEAFPFSQKDKQYLISTSSFADRYDAILKDFLRLAPETLKNELIANLQAFQPYCHIPFHQEDILSGKLYERAYTALPEAPEWTHPQSIGYADL